MSTSPQRAEVFTIVSGKGGVGKTSLAANLGVALARRGKRVVLLDGDFGHADAGILLNVPQTLDDADKSAVSAWDAVSDASAPGELRVARASREMTNSRGSMSVIADFVDDCDQLLIDCPSGFDETTAESSLAADLLILVTTPEPTALAQAYAALKLTYRRGYHGRIGVVVNFARHEREARRTTQRLARVAAQFLGLSLEHLGHIAYDAHVPRAVRRKAAFVIRFPRCLASACIEAISQRLAPAPAVAAQRSRLWRRVAALFL